MRVFLHTPPGLSRAMDRITHALRKTAPIGRISFVSSEADADVVFLHVIGYDDTRAKIEKLRAQGKRFVMAQYCLRTTQRPSVRDWLPLWEEAALVWSYYDLDALAHEDGVLYPELSLKGLGVNFYHSPLGVDRHFYPGFLKGEPRFALLATGFVADSECLEECAAAVAQVGGKMFHVGHELNLGAHVTRGLHITDAELRLRYSSSNFVAGLRRVEGFEMPAAEGLCCGARPILFDRPHYRRWYEGLAVFIPEGDRQAVTESLVSVLRNGPQPVTVEERAEAEERFSWARIGLNFWESLR